MNSVKEIFNQIKEYAKNPLEHTRFISEDWFTTNNWNRQGDLYAIKIDNFDRTKYKLSDKRQLVDGITVGSRHTIFDTVSHWVPIAEQRAERVVVRRDENGKNVYGYMVKGPIIESDTRFTISHPEHCDFSLPAGIYQITLQCDTREMRAVLD
jgi:hypothetical protein